MKRPASKATAMKAVKRPASKQAAAKQSAPKLPAGRPMDEEWGYEKICECRVSMKPLFEVNSCHGHWMQDLISTEPIKRKIRQDRT